MQMSSLIIPAAELIIKYWLFNAHVCASNIKHEAKWASSLINMEIESSNMKEKFDHTQQERLISFILACAWYSPEGGLSLLFIKLKKWHCWGEAGRISLL